MKTGIPLISVGFDGYPLEDALRGLAKTGSTEICLCALDEPTQHVIPEKMNVDQWRSVRLLFEKLGLRLYGLEGHSNICDPKNLDKIRKRTEFTVFMNGRYIDLSAGPRRDEESFFRNIRKVIEFTEELDLLCCLETHGDIIDSGKNGSRIMRQVNSERIKICYDPANVYFYSRGQTDPVEDVKYAIDHTGIVHFKGVSHNENRSEWTFPPMKDSMIDYDAFFRVLEEHAYDGMIALEIETMFRFVEGKGFIKDRRWNVNEIIDAYRSEVEFLKSRLSWMS